MVNYIMRFSNNVYEVVDGNTNKILAYFIHKIDAINYHQKLLRRGLSLGNPQNNRIQYANKNRYFQQEKINDNPGANNLKEDYKHKTVEKKDSKTVSDLDLASSYNQFLNEPSSSVVSNVSSNKTTKKSNSSKTGEYSTSEYIDSLINSNSYAPLNKKDKNLIDLGPVDEEDDIFSTPRKDANESKEIDDWKVTKKDMRNVKKVKKRDDKLRKVQQKKLKD